MLRKGVYPYDYINCVERFTEISLPPIEAFYSQLNDEGISDEDYEHAQNVWKTFNMKSLRDYHDLYNKADVLQLADVFENFRDVCIKSYKLDPAWYYTAPGLAWDGMLKITKIELEQLLDYDMILMIEAGIRGGISTVTHRYARANNKYMSDYDASKPSVFILYLDANSLYATAMSRALPSHGFKWMNEDELKCWRDYPASRGCAGVMNEVMGDSEFTNGCILEVDLISKRIT